MTQKEFMTEPFYGHTVLWIVKTLLCKRPEQEYLFYITNLMVQYLIHLDPLAIPLAVPLSVPVCFLPPHSLLLTHPLECPSLCQCLHFHHLPSLQPLPTPLALPLPAPKLSKYLDMFLSLFLFTGAKKAAMSLPHFMITTISRNTGYISFHKRSSLPT